MFKKNAIAAVTAASVTLALTIGGCAATGNEGTKAMAPAPK